MIAYKHNKSLTINNIDVQGANLEIGIGNWFLGYTLLGDISYHIGLNINEMYSYKAFYRYIKDSKYFDIGISLDQYSLLHPNKIQNHISFFSNYRLDKRACYLEGSRRVNGMTNNFAAILGYTQKRGEGIFNWELDVNYKFYGNNFNKDYLERSIRYRNVNSPNLHNNSIGEFLYPLINTYRPFNQWSVYTEYQSESIHSICSKFSFEKKLLIKGLFLNFDYEGVFILPEKSEQALYNFYTGGLKYSLQNILDFELFITNKIMNLDIHYQTFYQSNVPSLGYSIKRLLNYQKSKY